MPRERKPLAVHNLARTTPKYVEDVPAVESSRPKFPKGLTGEGKRIFKKLARVLERRKALTEGEEELLRIYATLYVRHANAQEHLALEGEVCQYSRLNNRGEEVKTEKPNLWLAIAQDAEKNMVSILDRLGLSPLNRSKVRPLDKPKEKKVEDPMERLLATPVTPVEDEIDLNSIDEDSVLQ